MDYEPLVVLATLGFQEGVMHWRTAYSRDLLIHHHPPIKYWNELCSTLHKQYIPIPSFYDRDLINQLHRLTQKDLFVDKYRQKMELLLLRVGIWKEPRLTIARFLSGLNFYIRERVE